MILNKNNYFDWKFYVSEHNLNINCKLDAIRHWNRHHNKPICNKYLKLYSHFNWKNYVKNNNLKIKNEIDAFIHFVNKNKPKINNSIIKNKVKINNPIIKNNSIKSHLAIIFYHNDQYWLEKCIISLINQTIPIKIFLYSTNNINYFPFDITYINNLNDIPKYHSITIAKYPIIFESTWIENTLKSLHKYKSLGNYDLGYIINDLSLLNNKPSNYTCISLYSSIISKDFIANNILSNSYFNQLGIFQVHTSNSIKFFHDKIKNNYYLTEYHNIYQPALFFGIYIDDDINIIKQHNGPKYILWGGTDADLRYNSKNKKKYYQILKSLNVIHFSSSPNLQQRLNNLGFRNKLIDLTFCLSNKQFKPINKLGNCIYIYNGLHKGSESKYGLEIYQKVMQKLPQFKYLLSNELQVPYENIHNIYKQCFIGLRLTLNDACAMTVQEMGLMGIPVIHNSNYPNSIPWNNINDIIHNILSIQYNPLQISSQVRLYFNTKKITIIIYTYKRPYLLNNLLYMIYNNITNYRIHIRIYDDGTPYDYKFNNFGMDIYYKKFEQNHGKKNWFKFINHIYQDLKFVDFNYAIFLSDDSIVNCNFINKTINTFESIIDPKRVTLTLSNDRISSWTDFKQQEYNDQVNLSQWMEMAFICDHLFFNILNYSLNDFQKNNNINSSGVPAFLSKKLYQLDFNMYIAKKSLILISDFNTSTMNNNKKDRISSNDRFLEYYS